MTTNEQVTSYFTGTIGRDFFDLFAGDLIGSGVARTVYECTVRLDLVIKIEVPSHSFQNIREWEFWLWSHRQKEIRRWLAPCVAISPCGSVLLQERTTLIPEKGYPKKLPKFLTDTKRDNFGLLGKRVVSHDYALVVPKYSISLRKAEWW